jgi:hypothetical protein
MATGALKQIAKPIINNVVDFAKSFKDKFNIDAYHGTRQEVAINPTMRMFDGKPQEVLIEDEGAQIKAFLDKDESEGDTPSIQDLGTWFSEDPDVAHLFAGETDTSQIYPVKLKLENPKIYSDYETLEGEFESFMYNNVKLGNRFDIDDVGSKGFRDKLKNEGHDGILIQESTTDTGNVRQDYVVFDPKNIRSKFANFDPTKADSKDILAGVGYTAFGTLGGMGALSGLDDGT